MNLLYDMARTTYYLVRGGGEDHIVRRKEYHRRRAIAERKVLEEARGDPTMFHRNVCPACGQSQNSAEAFFNPVGFSFKICPNDFAVYMDPVPTDATLKRLYNDDAYSYHWTSEKPLAAVQVAPEGRGEFDDICRHFTFPADRRPTLLDVGCATGGFLLTAKPRFDVEGVELSQDLSDVARRQGLTITTGTIAEVQGETRFDVITARQLIEHITDPAALLRDAWRLLRPGGIMYINTPNIDSASFQLFRDRHMNVSSFGHVSLLSREALDRLAGRCGFHVVAHEYYGGTDVCLHDVLTFHLCRNHFRHRMALYSQRLYMAANLFDRLTFQLVPRMLTPRGNPRSQWAILCKDASGEQNGEQSR
jgi:2-polyprenyl-3-methyl-5-hydroxy-6-metoxy-1,4-benzoquinol methylase